MANKEVTIKISATDAASPQFKKIAAEAKAMGAQVSTSSKQASASLEDMQKKGAAVGAGFGALVGGVSLAGRAFVSQEQQIRGLNRAYGESSIEIQRFAEELQKSTTYSNDSARQAAQVASTLTRSYGLTAEQIQVLIGTTADLAAVNVTSTGAQFDLVDAVSRTAGAIRGEGEAAEALGLTLSDSAVAAAAAARGLTGWTTTMTEAEKAQFRFTLLLEQSQYAHGAAAEAAETNAGKARQYINSLQDQFQGLGEATGAAGEYLSVMGDMALVLPLVTGMLGKLGAAFGALGGGTALAGIAVLAGSGLLAYDANTNSYGTGSDIFAQFGSKGAGLANTLVPGNPFDSIQSQFDDVLKGNELVDAISKLVYVAPGTVSNEDVGKYSVGRLKAAGILPSDFEGTIDDAARYISGAANASGMTNSQYVARKFDTAAAYTFDPVTQQYVYGDTYTALDRQRRIDGLGSVGYDPRQGYGSMYAITQGQANLPMTFDPAYKNQYLSAAGVQGSMTRNQGMFNAQTGRDQQPAIDAAGVQGSMTAMGAQSVAIAENTTKALEAQYGAWIAVAGGITSTSEAMSVFNAAQNELSGEMGTYQAQASEWTGQLNAQEAAYKILEERQANGIDLTKEQTDFMNEYAHAVEVGTGAVEDSTIAAGIAAQNLLLNKESADIFKTSTGELTTAIELLIETLGGVPDDVRTQITLDGEQALHDALDRAVNHLNEIDGQTATFYINTQNNGISVGNPNGPGITADLTGMNGLTMNAYAGGGTVYGGNHALVGERGPEVVWLPNGSQVMNTEGSKSRMSKGRRGGGDIVNYGPINLQPASTDVYGALSSQLMGGVR